MRTPNTKSDKMTLTKSKLYTSIAPNLKQMS